MSQWIITGLAEGLTLSLFALALALVHGATRVLMLALGAVHALVPFVAWQLMGFVLPAPFAFGCALLVGALLAWAIEIRGQSPLDRIGASSQVQVLSSLGLYVVLTQAIALAWTSDPLWFDDGGSSSLLRIGGVVLAGGQPAMLILPPLILIATFVWLHRTRLGLKLRALADNPAELSLRGIDPSRLRSLVCAVAGLLVAASALLSARDSGFAANTGLHPLLLALAAMIIGGRHALSGVVLAAILIGLLRAAIGTYGDARWQDAVTFLLLLAILLLRPQGLFGRVRRIEAA